MPWNYWFKCTIFFRLHGKVLFIHKSYDYMLWNYLLICYSNNWYFLYFFSQISTSVWTLICVQTVQLVSTLKAPTNVDVLQDSRDLSVARVGNRFKNKKSDKNYDVLFITSGYFFTFLLIYLFIAAVIGMAIIQCFLEKLTCLYSKVGLTGI